MKPAIKAMPVLEMMQKILTIFPLPIAAMVEIERYSILAGILCTGITLNGVCLCLAHRPITVSPNDSSEHCCLPLKRKYSNINFISPRGALKINEQFIYDDRIVPYTCAKGNG